MDNSKLEKYTLSELKKIGSKMDLPPRRSKKEMIREISKAFKEYENYKKNKLDKYTKNYRLGNKGKEGVTYLVTTKNGKEYAMKTFRKTKSSEILIREYNFQKQASRVGISPRVIENDTVSKYIIMEKMDCHLLDVIKKQKGNMTRTQQERIIDIFTKLDECKIFHGDSNLTNYMLKDNIIYIIDYGFSKEVNSNFIKKIGTSNPNMDIMLLGFILKLKELNCLTSSYKYLLKYLSQEHKKQFKLI